MTHRILYGHFESGHSYKVKLALTLFGLEHEYREVEIFRPRNQRRADFQAATRFGEIPVLVEDGKAVSQSNAILLHLARTTGAMGWETDPDALTEWMFWEANRIGISLPNARLYAKWEPSASKDLKAWLHARLHADLGRLNEELARKPFLMGDAVTAADCSCCGYLFFAGQVPIELSAWPHVFAWLDRIRALPGWKHPYELLREHT